MSEKIMIAGRTGCGKDTSAYCFIKNYGKEQLISYATRDRRFPGEATHIFISNEEANKMTNRVAETIIDGNQYFATKEQLDACDIYVIDPKGLSDVCSRAPETDLCVLYVKASKNTRRQRAIDRAADKELAAKIFESRHADEDQMFSEFESLIEADNLDAFHEKYPTVKKIIILNNESTSIGEMDKKVDEAAMYIDQLTMGDEFGPYRHVI